jgi:cob(I)alamin adenosyltransferase
MVQLTRIYTKSGDKGKTALGNGQRVYKNCARIEAIGDVDEANAFLGWAIQFCQEDLAAILLKIQNDLFDLGADLCVPENPNDLSTSRLTISSAQVDYLEQKIDLLNADLPPLTSFVLPGGTQTAAALHLARTVVRRAERRVVALSLEETINHEVVKYLNRLSDLLFVMARFVNHQKDAPGDVLWVPGVNR